MIEFDVECRRCRKPITLRVRDEESRMFFEENGALSDDCNERGHKPERLPCSASPA
jgi:hypothetical protein